MYMTCTVKPPLTATSLQMYNGQDFSTVHWYIHFTLILLKPPYNGHLSTMASYFGPKVAAVERVNCITKITFKGKNLFDRGHLLEGWHLNQSNHYTNNTVVRELQLMHTVHVLLYMYVLICHFCLICIREDQVSRLFFPNQSTASHGKQTTQTNHQLNWRAGRWYHTH